MQMEDNADDIILLSQLGICSVVMIYIIYS